MFTPRLHGRFVDEEQLSGPDAAALQHLTRSLSNFKRTGQIDSLRWRRRLPSGRTAVLVDAGGTYRVRVLEAEGDGQDSSGRAGLGFVPMLFSGVITNDAPFAGEGVTMTLTRHAARRIGGYGNPVGERQRLQRFEIEYANRHAEFRIEVSSTRVFTQYNQLRPTWFSGRMASLVQIVGGYGRQDLQSLPDTPVERAQFRLPAKVLDKALDQLGRDVLLPGYTGKPPQNGQIQYDYKFVETHGVTLDSANKPWLVRINNRGVYVMPLPMVPVTTTLAFREYVEGVGDDELLWVLDKFGGLPTGESFPEAAADFEAWRRAGVIIKVCDIAQFFASSAYSTTIGWCFNSSGREAVNTCYTYGDDGIQTGLAYKIWLNLGSADRQGMVRPQPITPPDDAQRVQAYLGRLMREVGQANGHRERAIRYKLRRASISELIQRSKATSEQMFEREAVWWENLEDKPLAQHAGGLVQFGRGRLWASGPPQWHPQIKFPEPNAVPRGCISHDFGRLEGYPQPNPEPRCDTIMFAFYVDDDLKVVKYFYDPRQFTREEENNFDECMQVGSWEQFITEGSSSIQGRFYTTDFDEREVLAPRTVETKIVGKDLGFDHTPRFSFDTFNSRVGTMSRSRYFTHERESVTRTEPKLEVAACVPYFGRSSVVHGYRKTDQGVWRTKARNLYSTQDPNSYRFYTYHSIFAWVPGSSGGNVATAPGYDPAPRDGVPVWITGYNYHPYPCSDFADEGDWVGGLPADYTWLIHPDANVWISQGGGIPPNVKNTSETKTEPGTERGRTDITLMPQSIQIPAIPRNSFFEPSPTEWGDVFYTDVSRVLAGEATYGSTYEPTPGSPYRTWQGYTRLANHQSAHNFIGVINE